jgi:hypothetical protein
MRKLVFTAGAALAVLAIAGSSALATRADDFKTRLIGFQEVPAISTNATGRFTAELDDGTLHYRLAYSGLEGGSALFAHIHLGQRSVNGGVVAFLCGGGDKPACPATTGTVTGTIDPADVIGPVSQGIAPGEFAELVRAMRAGVTYANVHSTAFPGGEIRGQIRKD